ncbi:hypothetical protein [Duncaniella muris]|uniref:hypothetical protein n=1 Tax=Duncaniella muris TaxID=2094150 RepID=UPI00272DE1CC|nr:hypothetical protein [Duncaniella muris]
MAGMFGHKKSPLNMSSINRALRERQTFLDVALQIYDKKFTLAKKIFKNAQKIILILFCGFKYNLYLCSVIKERLRRTKPDAEKRKA